MNRNKRLVRAAHRTLEHLTVRILAAMGPQGQAIRRRLELLYQNSHPAEEGAAAGRRDLTAAAAGDTCDERGRSQGVKNLSLDFRVRASGLR